MALVTPVVLTNAANGISIPLAVDTVAAPFVGFHLVSYEPEPTPYETARNSSIYSDGSTIADYKAANVIETWVVNIHGSTPADAYEKLRLLKRWAWMSRDYNILIGSRTPSLIQYTPVGTSQAVYAAVVSALVADTAQSGRASVEGNIIKNVTLSVEREPYWRGWKPQAGFQVPGDYMETNAGVNAAPIEGKWWGIISVNNAGASTDLKELGGDVPALIRMKVEGINGGVYKRIALGYQSQIRDVESSAYIPPSGPLLIEAESMFAVDPQTTSAIDTTASPYNASAPANTRRQYTDLAGSGYTAAERLFGAVTIGNHAYRLFLRMKVAAAAPLAVYSVFVNQSLVGQIGPAQLVVYSTDYRMYDMGVLRLPRTDPPEWNQLTGWPYTESVSFRINTQIISSMVASPAPLYIDFALLIPCDEYYITDAPTDFLTIYNNIQTPAVTQTVLGELKIPPGKGTFYYVAGNDQFENSYQTVSNRVAFTLSYCELFESPAGL